MTYEQEQLVQKHNLRTPSIRIRNENRDLYWLSSYIIVLRSKNSIHGRHFENQICYVELNGDRRKYKPINQVIVQATQHLADNPWTWLRNRARKKAKWEKKKASTQICTPKS